MDEILFEAFENNSRFQFFKAGFEHSTALRIESILGEFMNGFFYRSEQGRCCRSRFCVGA